MSRYHQHRADELEIDIRQTRAQLDDTLHALESRLSPTQLKHSISQYLPRKNGIAAGFLSSLEHSIRKHPAPALMTGIGLGWLVVSQLRASRRDARPHDSRRPGATLSARQQAPQCMIATHLGTQQGRTMDSAHRPDVIGVATHLGTGQGWRGYVHPAQ
ncbi:DUF3618 domain-containing protein [Halomonas sp. MCCC 1A11036]|uniref:DUF3618 domain-containing protein n=1 Tax=Billgrantia zhangzhouensis TaxID=2733481 RepID=A0ABS9AGZ4_9GAMM|nr:DUF3618 domain-containing protein [Halomonas zhangzhouensis]MCE8021030.1 DUF3618 domain-containing protein [Halomonas zhangzhouensis]